MPEDASPAHQRGRHEVVTGLVLVHVPVFALLGFRQGWSPLHIVAEVVLPLVALWAMARFGKRPRLAQGAGAIGLMYASAILIHVTGGVTEAHFYFFVAFGLVALYRDWIVFFAAAAFAVGHHIVFALADGALFEQPYQLENPLFWALVHVGFVTIITAVQAVGMYDVARSVAATARLEAAVERADERRRTALSLHDNVVQAIATATYARSLGEDQMSADALGQAMSASRTLVTELLGDTPIGQRDLSRGGPALQER